jgi:hypothetical protein
MQFPSTAENSVNDTSIAVICGLAISNARPSSRHRSESAAQAADTALSAAITIEHRKTTWRYKAISPWGTLRCSMPKGDGFRKIKTDPPSRRERTDSAHVDDLRQLLTSAVSCRRNGQEGDCRRLERHSIGGRRSAYDRRQLIPRVQRQRAAVQPNVGIP